MLDDRNNRERGITMQRALIAGAVVTAAFLVSAAAALAVQPKKGGVYVGDIRSTPFEMHVSLQVTSTRKTARFTYLCGTGRAPTTISGLVIDGKGYFKFASNPATGHDWKLAGHFLTPTTARISLNSIDCGGSKGSVTAKLK
jgi:hypothetical protein